MKHMDRTEEKQRLAMVLFRRFNGPGDAGSEHAFFAHCPDKWIEFAEFVEGQVRRAFIEGFRRGKHDRFGTWDEYYKEKSL